MIQKPHVDWFAISPSLALLGAAGLLLMVAVFVPRGTRRPVSASVAFMGFAVDLGRLYLIRGELNQAANAMALASAAQQRDIRRGIEDVECANYANAFRLVGRHGE